MVDTKLLILLSKPPFQVLGLQASTIPDGLNLFFFFYGRTVGKGSGWGACPRPQSEPTLTSALPFFPLSVLSSRWAEVDRWTRSQPPGTRKGGLLVFLGVWWLPLRRKCVGLLWVNMMLCERGLPWDNAGNVGGTMWYPVEAGAALATLFGSVLSDICPTYGHLFSSPSTKRTYTSCISQSSLEEEILKRIY